MVPDSPRLNARDILTACGLGALFAVFSFALTQRNLTYDGAAFLALFDDVPRPGLPHHPLFGYMFWAFLRVGSAVGLGHILAGQIFAAVWGGVSITLFHLLLRRHAVGAGTSAIFALLLGLNMMVLENATTVELYTPSLAAVVWTLHAARSLIAEGSSPGRIFALWLSSMAVVGLHLGFAPWIFALYVALAASEAQWKMRGVWLLRGASVLAGIVLWIVLEGYATSGELEEQKGFFATYGRLEAAWSVALILFESPLEYLGRHAGLIVFPAAWGAGLFRRERPTEFRAALIALVLFWAVYSFWALDFGSFFMPLLPVWGLGAALAHDAFIRRSSARSRMIMLGGLVIHAYLFLFLPALMGDEESHAAVMQLLQGLLWIWLAALVIAARWFVPMKNEAVDAKAKSIAGHQVVFGILAVTLSLLACVPRLLSLREPDDTTLLTEQFAEIAEPGARLVTHLSPFRPEVETGRECLSGVENWNDWNAMARNRKRLTEWLREMAADPEGQPLYVDHRIYQQRDFVFGNLETGNRTEVGMDRLEFNPVKAPQHVFYRVEFKDAADREIVGRGLDLFDMEDWGGVAVRWTRRSALLRFEASGRYLRLKYWIGHPDVTDVNPVEARISVDGELKLTQKHATKDAYTLNVDLGEGPFRMHEIMIEFSRTWTSPDGRELGAGLYPLEFSDQP